MDQQKREDRNMLIFYFVLFLPVLLMAGCFALTIGGWTDPPTHPSTHPAPTV